jgi:hypothetical protein
MLLPDSRAFAESFSELHGRVQYSAVERVKFSSPHELEEHTPISDGRPAGPKSSLSLTVSEPNLLLGMAAEARQTARQSIMLGPQKSGKKGFVKVIRNGLGTWNAMMGVIILNSVTYVRFSGVTKPCLV